MARQFSMSVPPRRIGRFPSLEYCLLPFLRSANSTTSLHAVLAYASDRRRPLGHQETALDIKQPLRMEIWPPREVFYIQNPLSRSPLFRHSRGLVGAIGFKRQLA